MSRPRIYQQLTRFFWLSMAFVLLLGLALLLGSVAWQSDQHESIHKEVVSDLSKEIPDLKFQTSEGFKSILVKWEKRLIEERFGPVALRDFAIALLIAVFVTVAIELYAGNKLRSQIAQDVLEAVYSTIVPPEIYKQVADSVFRATALKKDWEIFMTLRSSADLKADLYISSTIVNYKMYGLLNRPQPDFRIFGGLDLDITDSNLGLPRYTKITVAGKVYEGQSLESIVDKTNQSFTVSAHLQTAMSDEHILVTTEVEEIIRVPDTFVWSTATMTEGARINIDATASPELEFELVPLHPNRQGLDATVQGKQWYFPHGMLPWQGFEIRVKRKDLVDVLRVATTT
jgi:hypothetical protein